MLHSEVEIIIIKSQLDTRLGKLWCLGRKRLELGTALNQWSGLGEINRQELELPS